MRVDLRHEHDTWGNYGQHRTRTDYVRQGDHFVRCDQADGAVVEDHSAHSRKNRHEDVRVTVDVPAGTLVRTTEASSSNSSRRVEYWRVGEAGERIEIEHQRQKTISGRVAEAWDVLADGERVLATRAPHGVRTNDYSGDCACGTHVPAGQGELRKVNGRWTVRCVDCFVAAGKEVRA